MRNSIYICLILVAIVISGFRISKSVQFKQNVTGYLKRAADANTIKLAHEEVTKALDYLESNQITSGYTSILYQTPDEDIDFWYRNLKATQQELQNLNTESALEKTNVLIKLRETLVDSGKKTKVTVPDGIAVFPNNKLWGFLMFIAISCGFIGFIGLAYNLEEAEKAKRAKAAKEGC